MFKIYAIYSEVLFPRHSLVIVTNHISSKDLFYGRLCVSIPSHIIYTSPGIVMYQNVEGKHVQISIMKPTRLLVLYFYKPLHV